MTQERRSVVRREADRQLLRMARDRRYQEVSDSEEQQRRKRRAVRHNCEVEIALLIRYSMGGGDEWNEDRRRIKGRILDLSAQGASIFTAQQMDMGQNVGLVIKPRNQGRIDVAGAVRWTKHIAAKRGYASGVEFTRIDGKSREAILAFLRELDTTIGM